MATLKRECWHCEGYGRFALDHPMDPDCRSSECENCDGEGEVDARCDTPRCNRWAVTGIDGEFYCVEHAADFAAPLILVTVPSLAACRGGVQL